MEDLLIIEDFFGKQLIVCPFQFERCEHQFSMCDGAFLGCACDECYETKKCIKDEILIDFLIVIVNVSFIIFFILNILL